MVLVLILWQMILKKSLADPYGWSYIKAGRPIPYQLKNVTGITDTVLKYLGTGTCYVIL